MFSVHLSTLSLSAMWLILLVVLGLAEAATVNLVSIWFAAGALVALLVSLFCANFWVQLIVFIVVSVLSLALIRPLVRKRFIPHIRPTNLDLLTGKTAVVTEMVHNLAASGQVKVGGQTWTARSESGEPIPVGAAVIILRIEGVKLVVRETDSSAE